MLIEFVNARNKYGDFWTHGASPLVPFFNQRTSWFKDLSYEAPIIRKVMGGDYRLFIDIGAGWGYHTIIAAHHIANVIAVESNPVRYGLFLYNTYLLKNVEPLWAFVGREGQQAKRSESPWHPVEIDQPEIPIKAVTLDMLVNRSPHYPLEGRVLVKIDVEGSELDVLAGATELLKDPNIDWVIEVHTRYNVTVQAVDAIMKGKKKEELSPKHFFYGS